MNSEREPYIKRLLHRFRELREAAGISQSSLEESLILGPGWVNHFEEGQCLPTLDMLIAMLDAIGSTLNQLIASLEDSPDVSEIERYIYAVKKDNGINIHFQYSDHDATYFLDRATTDQFEEVMKELRNGLAQLVSTQDQAAIKTEAVSKCFRKAVSIWPHANPSDIWWFLVYRAFCDSFNHPAIYSRLDFSQSWKRTGGWALEQIIVKHYEDFLKRNGVEIIIASNEIKERYLQTIHVDSRLEADKIDVLLLGEHNGAKHFFGVVHVKASFAERRTDDVPMSQALIRAGYVSPLCTMDCKSSPSGMPINKGELGNSLGLDGTGIRSAKRKDIEDDGYFSACFSYNRNTKPTPEHQNARARIYVCDFSNPDDVFAKFIIGQWRRFRLEKIED